MILGSQVSMWGTYQGMVCGLLKVWIGGGGEVATIWLIDLVDLDSYVACMLDKIRVYMACLVYGSRGIRRGVQLGRRKVRPIANIKGADNIAIYGNVYFERAIKELTVLKPWLRTRFARNAARSQVASDDHVAFHGGRHCSLSGEMEGWGFLRREVRPKAEELVLLRSGRGANLR